MMKTISFIVATILAWATAFGASLAFFGHVHANLWAAATVITVLIVVIFLALWGDKSK